jgi:hypothetical protein
MADGFSIAVSSIQHIEKLDSMCHILQVKRFIQGVSMFNVH